MQVRLVEGDATESAVDVLVLKFAQGRHGLDYRVHQLLADRGIPESQMNPRPGEVRLVSGSDLVAAKAVLFVGTDSLARLDYALIRELARTTLASARGRPRTSTQRALRRGLRRMCTSLCSSW